MITEHARYSMCLSCNQRSAVSSMSIVYLLQNQHSQYLGKSGEWIEGDAGLALYRSAFKDEAINQKVEFSVKSADLRISIVEASLGKNGKPELAPTEKIDAVDIAPAESTPEIENADTDTDTDTDKYQEDISSDQEQTTETKNETNDLFAPNDIQEAV